MQLIVHHVLQISSYLIGFAILLVLLSQYSIISIMEFVLPASLNVFRAVDHLLHVLLAPILTTSIMLLPSNVFFNALAYILKVGVTV